MGRKALGGDRKVREGDFVLGEKFLELVQWHLQRVTQHVDALNVKSHRDDPYNVVAKSASGLLDKVENWLQKMCKNAVGRHVDRGLQSHIEQLLPGLLFRAT